MILERMDKETLINYIPNVHRSPLPRYLGRVKKHNKEQYKQ